MTKPVLTEGEISELLARPKLLSRKERDHLLRRGGLARFGPSHPNPDWPPGRTILSAKGPGLFLLHASQSIRAPDHFNAQLVYRNDDGQDYPLLRCGRRPLVHTNELERTTISDVSRVNRLTERYQRLGRLADGFAVPARPPFESLAQALDAACAFANIRLGRR